MPDIFLSYRRKDSEAIAWHIRDRLNRHFGPDSVFIDVDTIPVGIDFRKVIQQEIARCQVLIVIIGPNWLNEQDKYGARRIDANTDWVRIEVEAALERNIQVIPVLVKEARLPRDSELPDSIENLAFRNAARVRSGRDFDADMHRLIRDIDRYLAEIEEETEREEEEKIQETERENEKSQKTEREEEEKIQEIEREREEKLQQTDNKHRSIQPATTINPTKETNTQITDLDTSPSRQRILQYVIGIAIILGLGFVVHTVWLNQSSKSKDDKFLSYSAADTEEKLISAGNRDLEGIVNEYPQGTDYNYRENRANAITAFNNKRYLEAAELFEEIREKAKEDIKLSNNSDDDNEDPAKKVLNDSTLLIFKNNAIARYRYEVLREELYTIVVSAPLTDADKNLLKFGQYMLQGIAQAQDKMLPSTENMETDREAFSVSEDKGIPDELQMPGLNLEIIVANDRNIKEQASEVARIISAQKEQSNILAVVGHYTSDSTCAALPEYIQEDSKIAVISPLSTLTNINTRCVGSPYFFRTPASSKIAAKTLVDRLESELQKTGTENFEVALFYNKEDMFSYDLFNQVQSIIGQRNIRRSNFQLSDPRFDQGANALLREIESAQALIVLPDGRNKNSDTWNNAIELIKSDTEKKRVVFGSNPLYDKETIDLINEEGEETGRLFLLTDWHHACAPDIFNTETDRYWGGRLNRVSALSYEAVQVLAFILADSVTDPEAQGVRQIIQQRLDGLNEQPENSPKVVKSHIFKNATISFKDDDEMGDRAELENRLIVTGSDNEKDPFKVVGPPEAITECQL